MSPNKVVDNSLNSSSSKVVDGPFGKVVDGSSGNAMPIYNDRSCQSSNRNAQEQKFKYLSVGELNQMQNAIQTEKQTRIEDAYNSFPISRRTCVQDKNPHWKKPQGNYQQTFNYPDQRAIDFKLEERTTASLNPYYNQYEYGAKQDTFGDISRDPYLGPYSLNPSSLENLGLSPNQYMHNNPAGIRNVVVESVLYQKEMARRPKQSGLSQIEVYRFEELPWDPQDVRHIVWTDGLPQGGISTRNDRLEYQ